MASRVRSRSSDMTLGWEEEKGLHGWPAMAADRGEFIIQCESHQGESHQ